MIRRFLVLLALTASLAGCAGSSPGQAPAPPPLVGSRSLDARERAAFDEIVAWAEQTRGLTLDRHVLVQVVDEPTMRRLANGLVSSGAGSDRSSTLRTMGVVANDVSPESAVGLDLAREQTLAIYSHAARSISLRESLLGGLGETTNAARESQLYVLHEIVHAMQFAHLVDTRRAARPDDLDRELAFRALIEGDATFAMVVAYARATGLDVGRLIADRDVVAHLAETALARSATSGATPEIARARILGPYSLGASFVAALYADGGWASVDAIFERADSLTTELILHPELLDEGHVAEPCDPPVVQSVANAARLVDQTTLGELMIRSYFARLGSSEAAVVAAGWAGDRVRTYRRRDGSVATIWVSTWDTIRDAAEVADASRRLAETMPATSRGTHQVVRLQRAVLITDGLTPAERLNAAQVFETYVYASVRPIDAYDPPGN